MRGPYLFPALAGQTVVALRVCEPWVTALPPTVGPASLFGAIVLQCNQHALLCHASLRYMADTKGSKFGLYDGGFAELPFRASLCEVDDLEHWLPLTGAAHWSDRTSPVLPMPGDVLSEAPQLVRDSENGPWQLEYRFATGRCFRLQYRADLDASLQFAPSGHQYTVDRIVVSSPEDAFGWLHPGSAYPFVLAERCWRSAQVSDWPWPVRKQLQTSAQLDTFYRDTLIQALAARFRQWPVFRKRLLAMELPTHVTGVPAGMYEQVRERLRFSGLGRFP